MTVVHFANDLMLVGKVSAWCKKKGVSYTNASNADKFQNALQLLTEVDVGQRVVLVDLQVKSLDASATLDAVRSIDAAIPVYGYAQHVMVQIIQQAKDAGFDRVLTRGQFDHGFADLIQN